MSSQDSPASAEHFVSAHGRLSVLAGHCISELWYIEFTLSLWPEAPLPIAPMILRRIGSGISVSRHLCVRTSSVI